MNESWVEYTDAMLARVMRGAIDVAAQSRRWSETVEDEDDRAYWSIHVDETVAFIILVGQELGARKAAA